MIHDAKCMKHPTWWLEVNEEAILEHGSHGSKKSQNLTKQGWWLSASNPPYSQNRMKGQYCQCSIRRSSLVCKLRFVNDGKRQISFGHGVHFGQAHAGSNSNIFNLIQGQVSRLLDCQSSPKGSRMVKVCFNFFLVLHITRRNTLKYPETS